MTFRPAAVLTATGAAIALAATGASASMMHTKLGAQLSGMGNHATVNLTASSGKLCWAFDAPSVKSATRATIRTGSKGPVLVELGMHYTKSGCAKVAAMTLDHLETKPAAYSVWIDTKGHPGDLRGKLFAGTAKM
jgi:hypothetical protein